MIAHCCRFRCRFSIESWCHFARSRSCFFSHPLPLMAQRTWVERIPNATQNNNSSKQISLINTSKKTHTHTHIPHLAQFLNPGATRRANGKIAQERVRCQRANENTIISPREKRHRRTSTLLLESGHRREENFSRSLSLSLSFGVFLFGDYDVSEAVRVFRGSYLQSTRVTGLFGCRAVACYPLYYQWLLKRLSETSYSP